jgi:hypothetical protein
MLSHDLQQSASVMKKKTKKQVGTRHFPNIKLPSSARLAVDSRRERRPGSSNKDTAFENTASQILIFLELKVI